MIELMLTFGTDYILIVVDGNDIKFGNTIMGTVSSGATAFNGELFIFNNNSASAQNIRGYYNLSTPSLGMFNGTATVNTTSAIDINFVIYTAGSSQATSLYMYTIEFGNI